MKKSLIAVLLLALPAIASAATTRAQMLMGTICEITVPDESASQIDKAFAEGKRVDELLSTWRDDTELSRVNRGEQPSEELRRLLAITVDWAHRTNSAFDPLVGPLVQAWQIRGAGAVPSKETLAAATAKASLANVNVNVSPIVMKNGAAFEEGAFGKGYAIDRMLWVLRSNAVHRASINFGGQIGVYGDQPWVTIADPEHRDTPAVGLLLANRSISTSSGSEKSFKSGSHVFTHLIDPRSGEALPPRGSVSVIDKSALNADILSTALYVMGPDEGLKWAREHNVAAVFITPSGKVLTSANIPGLQVFIKER